MTVKEWKHFFVLYCGTCPWTGKKGEASKNECTLCRRGLYVASSNIEAEVDEFIESRLWP